MSGINGVTTCSFENMSSCDALISSITNYGSHFSSQFEQSGQNSGYEASINMVPTGEVVPGNPFSMYKKDIPPLKMDPAILAARKQLVADTEMVDNGYYILSNIMQNTNSLNSISSYNEKEYMDSYYGKLINLYDEFHRSTGDERAGECWSLPQNCQRISAKFHDKLKKLKNEIAILDLDDMSDFDNGNHYIRIFNVKSGLYVGKILYLADPNSSIFDNVGRSLAAAYALEPSSIYNNGYFYTGLSQVKLNVNRTDDQKYKNQLRVADCRNKSKDSASCAPIDLYLPEQGAGEKFVRYNSRLIISPGNNPLKYSGITANESGVGLISPKNEDISVSLDEHFKPFSDSVLKMFDPASLRSKYVSELIRDNRKIYYTGMLDYSNPGDCLALHQEVMNLGETKFTPAWSAKVDYCQYLAYHQGTALNSFSLRFSLLTDDKTGYDPL